MSRVTPKVEARIRELHAQSLSTRKISEALKREGTSISHVTVAEVLKAPEKPASARVRAARGITDQDADELPTRPFPVARAAEVVDELPPDAHPQVRMLHDRIGSTRLMGDRALEERDTPAFRDMVRLEAELVKSLVALTPPRPPNPDEDPANIQARDAVRDKLRDMIEDAERRAGRLCPRCMQHPSATGTR